MLERQAGAGLRTVTTSRSGDQGCSLISSGRIPVDLGMAKDCVSCENEAGQVQSWRCAAVTLSAFHRWISSRGSEWETRWA